MTHPEFINHLKREIAAHGSQRKYAKHIGISAVHIGRVLKGTQHPGDDLLARMGFHRVVNTTYEPIAPLKHTPQLKIAPAYLVEGYSGWFVVRAPNAKRAKSVGVQEFGRGKVVTVRLATPAEIKSFESQKGEIETAD